MGVDYSSRTGLGYQILVRDDLGEKMETYEALELLEDKIEHLPYKVFVSGDAYDGDMDLFIVLKEPFKKSWNAQLDMENLAEFLGENSIDIVDSGLVGGLSIT